VNRNNNRDVTEYELQQFKKKFKCASIEKEGLDIDKFEEDNPNIAVDIYYIPMTEESKVKLIYRSKNSNPEYQIALGVLENRTIVVVEMVGLMPAQMTCATIEPNTGKNPILHPFSHT
jgi:hypothetical protein